MPRSRTAFALAALLLLAPTLAVVIISVLLLLGVDPHVVFLPGHLVRSTLEHIGYRVPNRIGVLSTVVFWWGVVVSVWLTLRRIWPRRGLTSR